MFDDLNPTDSIFTKNKLTKQNKLTNPVWSLSCNPKDGKLNPIDDRVDPKIIQPKAQISSHIIDTKVRKYGWNNDGCAMPTSHTAKYGEYKCC